MTLIRVAHSPDSDDAFMFYALANGLIDTGDLQFEHMLSDIETLNKAAFGAPTRSPRCRSTPMPTSTSNTRCSVRARRWVTATVRCSWLASRSPPIGLRSIKVAIPGR